MLSGGDGGSNAGSSSGANRAYDALFSRLRAKVEQERPKDALRFLRALIDREIELRQARSLSEGGSSSGGDDASLPLATPLFRLAPPHCRRPRRPTLFGLDVGGSLCKVSFFQPAGCSDVESEFVTSADRYGSTGVRDKRLSFEWSAGTFHFVNFETRRMHGAIAMMRQHALLHNDEALFATGGGAHKFAEHIQAHLGLRVVKGDELQCLLWGINFMLQHVPHECYYLADPKRPLTSATITLDVASRSVFPYLLVNIGSGVSILKVDSNQSFQRVSGTIMGGGTFWGLCRMLTKCSSFAEAVELATVGDARNVNMLVGDIYGGDYETFSLTADTVASAFGKVGVAEDGCGASDADVARGLLEMIAQNIAQVAYLCARRYHLTRIFFCGNFLRNNRLSMGSIAYAIDYWSHGVQKALFMLHEGYFGSIGAFFLQDAHPWQPDKHCNARRCQSMPTCPPQPCCPHSSNDEEESPDCPSPSSEPSLSAAASPLSTLDTSSSAVSTCTSQKPPDISPFMLKRH